MVEQRIPKPDSTCDKILDTVLLDIKTRGKGGLILSDYTIEKRAVVLKYDDR
jgi:hypothetical protein